MGSQCLYRIYRLENGDKVKISNALWEINMNYRDITKVPFSNRTDAINTAIKSLTEWDELLEECGRVAIKDRQDLFNLIQKHIGRIEG